MTTITMMMLKMKIKEPKTFYFNPPLLNVGAIQLHEMWVNQNPYLIFCDAIDSGFSLTNFYHNDEMLMVSDLIAMFPGGLKTMFKTNKTIVSKLTITITNTDLSDPLRNDVAILNLKIDHD